MIITNFLNCPFQAGDVSMCRSCLAGFSCPNLGQTNVTEPCLAGHYCPIGTKESNSYKCPPGKII